MEQIRYFALRGEPIWPVNGFSLRFRLRKNTRGRRIEEKMNFFHSAKKLMAKLSFKVFWLLILCLVLPMCCMFGYTKANLEQYIQEELSNKIIQGMSRSQNEVYQTFQNMASISSMIVMNTQLKDTMQNTQLQYYDKAVAFDKTLNELMALNLLSADDMKVTFLDAKDNVYSDWSRNYNDYSFLLKQKWIQESIRQNGHITWSMFMPGYVIEPNKEEEKYISLARSMLSDGVTGKRVGTLIISIGQSQFNSMIMRYAYSDSDMIFVCLDDGEILLKNSSREAVPDGHVSDKIKTAASRLSGNMRDDYGGRQYLVSYYMLDTPWTFDGKRLLVMHYTDYRGVIAQMDRLSRQIDIGFLGFSVVIVFLMGFLSTKLVKPIRALSRQMEVYSIDRELQGLDMKRQDEIGHLNRAFARMSGNIRELFSRLNHEHAVREKYQFEALRAQVNPHFLFNTLNMIRWMAMIRQEDSIVECIDALVHMLKFSMSRGGELVPLDEEIGNIRSYVFIQNNRFGNQYEVKIDIDPELLHLQVIKFILQPIVENAVIHGFDGENGTIRIYGKRTGKILNLYVKDNGKGIPPDVVDQLGRSEDPHLSQKKVTGIGLKNVDERIKVTYGESYGIRIESRLGEGTTVIYTLPAIEGEEKTLEEDHDS